MLKKIAVVILCLLASVTLVAAQCMATTKKGTQCKRQASPDSSYCRQHGGTTKAQRAAGMTPADVAKSRCKATTKAGTQCKRSVQAGSDYCWQHAGQSGSVEKPATVAPVASAVTNEKKVVETAAPVTAARTQCTATTKSGKRCSRKAQPGSDKCWQHQ